MKLMKLLVAVLAVAVTLGAVSAVASDQSLPRNANRVERAVIKAMIDPSGSFAVMYRGEGIAGQCPINPGWTVTVTLRPDIDGTYIQSVCPRTGPTPCECDIFVRTDDMKRDWEAVLARYRADYQYTLPVDPSPRARVETVSVPSNVPRPCEDVTGRCLAITAHPFATVRVWRKQTPDASGVLAYPAEKGAPQGYTFSDGAVSVERSQPFVITDEKLLGDGELIVDFEHPAFQTVRRTVVMSGPKLAYHVNLYEEAGWKVQAR